jgi:hypothetical protein
MRWQGSHLRPHLRHHPSFLHGYRYNQREDYKFQSLIDFDKLEA